MKCDVCCRGSDPKYVWYNVDVEFDGKKYKIPFWCENCGHLVFPIDAVRDIVFIYPFPMDKKTIGGIHIPEQVLADEKTGYGYVLTAGSGYYDKKGKFHISNLKTGMIVAYDSSVLWGREFLGSDGKKHKIVYCGEQDVKAIVPNQRGVRGGRL